MRSSKTSQRKGTQRGGAPGARVAKSVEACHQLARAMYSAEFAVDAGVIHVTSVWRAPDGGDYTLAINDSTPRSELDVFALGLARARSDIIVTTARNLRLEPRLSHDLEDLGAWGPWLKRWREARSPGRAPPRIVVLTRGEDVPLDHPALRTSDAASPPLVYTSRSAAAALAGAAQRRGIQVLGRPSPSLRDCIVGLRRESSTVVVEAGASTATELYDDPSHVDELMLSRYQEGELPETARGPSFDVMACVESTFTEPPTVFEAREPSGMWSFLRYRRAR